MIQKLLLYKKGILRIRVTGVNYDRFLNLCAKQGIILWNLQYCQDAYEMDISIEGFRMLRPLVKKSGTRVRILHRHGLPFFFYRYRKRKMLFLGMICGLLFLYILSGFLWEIKIEGNQKITAGQIEHYMKEIHIQRGIPLSKIDCKELSAMLRKEFSDFTWVSVKQEGTLLSIRVKENIEDLNVAESAQKVKDGIRYDLIADRNGVITSMIIRKGVPVTQVGDIVKKGDVLVEGALEILNDSGEVTGYQYCCSDADVYLKTSYEYQEKISLIQKKKHYTGKQSRRYAVRIGNSFLYTPLLGRSFSRADHIRKSYPFSLFKTFYLPFSFEKETLFEYRYEKVQLDKKEAASVAEKNLYEFLEKIQEKGVQIFENNVKIEFDTKYCIAKGAVILIEKAGKTIERTTTE